MTPSDTHEAKARHLRRLYRQNRRADLYGVVKAEYDRLFPEPDVRLDHILACAWIEGRELAGWTRDQAGQGWRRADGSAVVDDDGREWAHL